MKKHGESLIYFLVWRNNKFYPSGWMSAAADDILRQRGVRSYFWRFLGECRK